MKKSSAIRFSMISFLQLFVLMSVFVFLPYDVHSAVGPPSIVLNDSDFMMLKYVDVPAPDQQRLVIREPGGTEHIIATTGDAATSIPGGIFRGFPPFFDMNNSGRVAFKVGLSPDYQPEDSAIYTGGIGVGLTLIARIGDVIGALTISDLSPFVDINDSNQVGFIAEHGGANIKGLYRYTPGTGIEIMAFHGQNVGGVTITELAPYHNVNSSGQMLTKATLSDGDQAFYLLGPTAGTRTLIARTGDPAPGGTFGDLNKAVFNDSGQVAFKCEISGVDSLVLYSGGIYTIIAQFGDNVGGGATIDGIAPNFDINNNGDVAFKAGLAGISGVNGGEPAGIYVWNGTSLQEAVRTGYLSGSDRIAGFSSAVALNDNGCLFFVGQFNEEEDGPDGLFCWCKERSVLLIIREGSFISGFGTITEVAVSGDVFERHINSIGNIAFKLVFNDNDDTGEAFIRGGCPQGLVSVPTMTELGIIIFMILAGMGSAVCLRRQKKSNS